MKTIDETSWITSDGMIWLQVLTLESALDILLNNLFELYEVNFSNETERLLTETDELEEIFLRESSDSIICIPVGKMEQTVDLLYYKIPE